MTAEDTEAMIADALEVEIEAWWQSADLPSACYLSARTGYLAGRSASRQRVERLEGALKKIKGGMINTDFVMSDPPDWRNAFGQLQALARAALEQDPPATAKAEGVSND